MRCRMVILVLGIAVSQTAWATQVLPLTGDELSQKADLIIVGTCMGRDVKSGPPSHTEYIFKIENAVKGNIQTGTTLTIRQWGGLPGAAPAAGIGSPRLLGMPVYDPGQRYMIFWGPESQAGFRSPVGLGQGVFRVMQSADGSTVVQNELGNRFLFPSEIAPTVKLGKAVPPPPRTVGPLRLKDFIQTIRKSGGRP